MTLTDSTSPKIAYLSAKQAAMGRSDPQALLSPNTTLNSRGSRGADFKPRTGVIRVTDPL